MTAGLAMAVDSDFLPVSYLEPGPARDHRFSLKSTRESRNALGKQIEAQLRFTVFY